MKKKSKLHKIFKGIALTMLILIVVFLGVRAIGKAIYNQTPEGGINESMYVDINGTKQWINIYGEDVNNPVFILDLYRAELIIAAVEPLPFVPAI